MPNPPNRPPRPLTDTDLDNIDRYLGGGRVSEAQGADMILCSDLTAEIRRLRGLGGQLYGTTTAEIHRLSELHGIVSSGLNRLYDALYEADSPEVEQEAWETAGEALTARLEPFLAPVDEPTEADPLTDDDLAELRRHASHLGDYRETGYGPARAWQDAAVALREAAPRLLDEIVRLRALVGGRTAPLFALGDFTAHSGARLGWKIECDALTDDDWDCLAAMAVEVLPPFGAIEGVPRGGMRFAEALAQYSVPGGPLLIADDVCTTGASLEDHRAGRDAIGVVAFARGPVPAWVAPLLTVGGRTAAPTRDEVRHTLIHAMSGTVTDNWANSIYVRNATDAVMALLSRSAAEPPESLPGEPLSSGFDFRPRTAADDLSPEAQRRHTAVVASSDDARRRAAAEAHIAVIGGVAAEPKETDSDA